MLTRQVNAECFQRRLPRTAPVRNAPIAFGADPVSNFFPHIGFRKEIDLSPQCYHCALAQDTSRNVLFLSTGKQDELLHDLPILGFPVKVDCYDVDGSTNI
jgi:hypothetical protein